MASASDPDFLVASDEDDVLISGEAVAIDLRPTGFVLRGAGLAIDWLVYFVGGTLLLVFVAYPILYAVVGKDSDAQKAVALAMSVVMLVVVPIVVELLSHGKSLGKLAVGARIVRDDGGAIGFRHAFIRAMVGVIEIYATFGGGAVIAALLNGRTKRLGDLLAGTYSQYERTSHIVAPAYGVPAEFLDWSKTADVGRMPDRLSRRISQFLAQASKLTPGTRVRVASDLATEASVWVYPVPAGDAELFLVAITALRRQREYTGLLLEQSRLEPLGAALKGLPHDFPDRG
jgi:uncharacterized RDD family membrane protein YckC